MCERYKKIGYLLKYQLRLRNEKEGEMKGYLWDKNNPGGRGEIEQTYA